MNADERAWQMLSAIGKEPNMSYRNMAQSIGISRPRMWRLCRNQCLNIRATDFERLTKEYEEMICQKQTSQLAHQPTESQAK